MITAKEARELAVGENSHLMSQIANAIRSAAISGKTSIRYHLTYSHEGTIAELKKLGYETRECEKSIVIKW